MKKIFLIFLFIILSSSFSLAKNNEKITVEDIEDIFLNKKEFSSRWKELWSRYSLLDMPENPVITFKSEAEEYSFYNDTYLDTPENFEVRDKKKLKVIEEKKLTNSRSKTRGIAKCVHSRYRGDEDKSKKCNTKVIRAVFTYPEKSKKRRPGDIFYALFAIKGLVYSWDNEKKYIERFSLIEGEDKPVSGMVCGITFEKIYKSKAGTLYKNEKKKYCKVLKKKFTRNLRNLKKIPQMKKF